MVSPLLGLAGGSEESGRQRWGHHALCLCKCVFTEACLKWDFLVIQCKSSMTSPRVLGNAISSVGDWNCSPFPPKLNTSRSGDFYWSGTAGIVFIHHQAWRQEGKVLTQYNTLIQHIELRGGTWRWEYACGGVPHPGKIFWTCFLCMILSPLFCFIYKPPRCGSVLSPLMSDRAQAVRDYGVSALGHLNSSFVRKGNHVPFTSPICPGPNFLVLGSSNKYDVDRRWSDCTVKPSCTSSKVWQCLLDCSLLWLPYMLIQIFPMGISGRS